MELLQMILMLPVALAYRLWRHSAPARWTICIAGVGCIYGAGIWTCHVW